MLNENMVFAEQEMLAAEHWNASHEAGDLWHNQHEGVKENYRYLFRASAVRHIFDKRAILKEAVEVIENSYPFNGKRAEQKLTFLEYAYTFTK